MLVIVILMNISCDVQGDYIHSASKYAWTTLCSWFLKAVLM